MPTLPTLTVTDSQAQRLLSAFGSVEAYKAWLAERLIDYVIAHEQRQRYLQWQEEEKARVETFRQEMNI